MADTGGSRRPDSSGFGWADRYAGVAVQGPKWEVRFRYLERTHGEGLPVGLQIVPGW